MSAKKKDKEEPSSAPKLFDVAKPGKTAASATSRPIIVGHGSSMKQDPMVTSPPSEEKKGNTEVSALRSHKEAVIKPDVRQDDNEKDESEKIPDAAAVDTLAQAANDKKEDQKEAEEVVARVLELEKIIESKQYFVPVGEAKRRRSNQRTLGVVILLLVLAIAGINFAIDAEALDIGIKPLTNLL